MLFFFFLIFLYIFNNSSVLQLTFNTSSKFELMIFIIYKIIVENKNPTIVPKTLLATSFVEKIKNKVSAVKNTKNSIKYFVKCSFLKNLTKVITNFFIVYQLTETTVMIILCPSVTKSLSTPFSYSASHRSMAILFAVSLLPFLSARAKSTLSYMIE